MKIRPLPHSAMFIFHVFPIHPDSCAETRGTMLGYQEVPCMRYRAINCAQHLLAGKMHLSPAMHRALLQRLTENYKDCTEDKPAHRSSALTNLQQLVLTSLEKVFSVQQQRSKPHLKKQTNNKQNQNPKLNLPIFSIDLANSNN